MVMNLLSSKSDDELIKSLEQETRKGNTSAKEALAFFASDEVGDMLEEETHPDE